MLFLLFKHFTITIQLWIGGGGGVIVIVRCCLDQLLLYSLKLLIANAHQSYSWFNWCLFFQNSANTALLFPIECYDFALCILIIIFIFILSQSLTGYRFNLSTLSINWSRIFPHLNSQITANQLFMAKRE